MAKEAVLETVTMTYGDDGILRIRINEGAVIGLDQAKLQYETIHRLCGDTRLPVLVDARSNHTVTKEAQEYGAAKASGRIATAVLNGNPFAKVSLNVFLSIFRPASTFRVFSDEEKAIEWLKEMRNAVN